MYETRKIERKGIVMYFMLALFFRFFADLYQGQGDAMQYVYLYPLLGGMLAHCILLSLPYEVQSHGAYGLYNTGLIVLILRSLWIGVSGCEISFYLVIIQYIGISLLLSSFMIFLVVLLQRKSVI